MHTTAAPPPHPSSMVISAIDDNNSARFPIIQVEVKIRVPDHLVGRLIGKSGICVKKIMEETHSHISISESRSQQEVHQYQTPELLDRIITIRGTAFGTVMAAEKQVQQKLRHIQDQDMNISGGCGGGGRQHFCPTPVPAPPGGILQSMDGGGGGTAAIGSYITPSAVTVTGAPMLSRGPPDNTYHHHPSAAATMYSAQCIPMGVAPQSFFVHNHPNAATNFPLTTGQFTHNIAVPNLPNLVHVKSRVYVPNQIVGILIGTKGQTIKSISAESGAVISIEGGDRDRQQKKYNSQRASSVEAVVEAVVSATVADNNNNSNNKSAEEDGKEEIVKKQSEEKGKAEMALQKGREEKGRKGEGGEAETEKKEDAGVAVNVADEADGGTTTGANSGSPSVADSATTGATVAIGQQSASAVVVTHVQQRPNDANSPRPVFIQGYDFQVSKAQYWVFQKVADSQNKNVDELELACEAIVPSRVIGRIIGKGGHNVKKLQQTSGARIKVPDDIRGNNKNSGDWATVSIYGSYYAVQAVQHHFGALISEAEWRDSREQDERRSRHWNGGNSR